MSGDTFLRGGALANGRQPDGGLRRSDRRTDLMTPARRRRQRTNCRSTCSRSATRQVARLQHAEAREGDAFGNRARSGRFEWQRAARRKPVNRTEGLTPQTVNAYYNDPMRLSSRPPSQYCLSLTRWPMTRSTTALLARLSGMRSAMVSTTKAASSTVTASCAIAD